MELNAPPANLPELVEVKHSDGSNVLEWWCWQCVASETELPLAEPNLIQLGKYREVIGVEEKISKSVRGAKMSDWGERHACRFAGGGIVMTNVDYCPNGDHSLKLDFSKADLDNAVQAEREKWTKLYHDKSGAVLDMAAIIDKATQLAVAQARISEAKWWEHLAGESHAWHEENSIVCPYCAHMTELQANVDTARLGSPKESPIAKDLSVARDL
jgi:hypothetical protein